ncbi:MAG: hypothetical protein QM651_16035 [Rhodoblastus sp.]
MTFPRLRALEAQWRRTPPLAWVVPAALGWKAPQEPAAAPPVPATPDAIDAMFPNGRFRG